MTHTKSLNASSIDPKAIAYVEKLAHRWREANWTFRPPHRLDAFRVDYIREHLSRAFGCDRSGSEALLIGPVLEALPRYQELMDQLDLRLISAVDTLVHAVLRQHGLGAERAAWLGDDADALRLSGLQFDVGEHGVRVRDLVRVSRHVRVDWNSRSFGMHR
jgi:hypothetical protein